MLELALVEETGVVKGVVVLVEPMLDNVVGVVDEAFVMVELKPEDGADAVGRVVVGFKAELRRPVEYIGLDDGGVVTTLVVLR